MAAKAYYKHIDGEQYDRELLDMAQECAKDGRISSDDAQKLWAAASDGKRVTDIEKRTILSDAILAQAQAIVTKPLP